MADEAVRATFALDVQSNAQEVGESSAEALERLQKALQGDVIAMRGMSQALRNLQGGKAVDIATTRKLRDEMAAAKARIAGTQQALLGLGGVAKGLPRPVKDAQGGVTGFADAVQKAGGPLGHFAGRLKAVSKLAKGGILVAGIAAIAAALVALTAASLAAAGALAIYALKQADARRSELIRLEGLTKLRYGYMGLGFGFQRAADKASTLQSALDSVTEQVALSRDEVAGYESSLYKMGLRGRNLQDALLATATTAAVQGDAAAQSFAGWAAGAAAAGQSVRKLADDVKARLGPLAREQLLALPTQLLKLRENVSHLFDGLKINGLLEALHTVFAVFNRNAAVAGALRQLIEHVFKAFGAGAPDAGLAVKRFIQGVTIGLLQVEHVVMRVAVWWLRTFGRPKVTQDFAKAVRFAELAVYGLGAAVALTLGGLALTAYTIYKVIQGLMVLGGALLWVVGKLYDGAKAFYDVGKSLVMGIGDGIKSGIAYVVKAALQAVNAPLAAAKAAMQIHSPSRRARVEVGRPMAQGVALGHEDELPRIRRSAGRVAQASLRGATVTDIAPRLRMQAAIGRTNPAAEAPPAPLLRAPREAPPAAVGGGPQGGRGAVPPVNVVFNYHAAEGGGAKGGADPGERERVMRWVEEGITEALRKAAYGMGTAAA
jgi:hypothetical protein